MPGEDASSVDPLLQDSSETSITSIRLETADRRMWDIVQFSTQIFFVDESEGKAVIGIMRMGLGVGKVSVMYHTEDGSATGGDQFQHVRGTLVFRDGQMDQEIQVPLMPDESWHAVNDFVIVLSEPEGCTLGVYLSVARVKILDKDMFPSNKYKLLQVQGEEGCSKINGPGLFWEYFHLSFNQPGMRWRTFTTLMCDQLHNGFLLLKTWIGKYMVDTLFNKKASSEDLVFFDNRVHEAFLLAGLCTAPLLILHVWDLLKIKIDVNGYNVFFLRTNLVGRYMNLSEESRNQLDQNRIQVAIMEGVYELSKGYTALLDAGKSFGTMTVLLSYAMFSNPGAWPIAAAMPCIMLLFFFFRVFCMSPPEDSFPAQKALLVLLGEITNNYKVIVSYFQRPKLENAMCEKVGNYRRMRLPEKIAEIHEEYFLNWLGAGFVGAYIWLEAPVVLGVHDGVAGTRATVTVGTFLATITIIREVADAFSSLFAVYVQLAATFDPVRHFTVMFNLQTDLSTWREISNYRRAESGTYREEARRQRRLAMDRGQPALRFSADAMKLHLQDVAFGYPSEDPLLKNVSLSVEQGKLVAIIGTHGGGKSTFLEILGHSRFPIRGKVFVPGHLRILQVSESTMIFESWSPMDNLCFGVQRASIDKLRVRKILQELNMTKTARLVDLDLNKLPDVACPPKRGKNASNQEPFTNPPLWYDHLSCSERAKICLARALIANPEVLVLHKPFINYELQQKTSIKRALIAHTENRGIGLPEEWRDNRRPRTIFFSVVDPADSDIADVVWQITSDKTVKMMGAKPMMPQQAENLGVSRHSFSSPAAATIAEPMRLPEPIEPMELHSTQIEPDSARRTHPMLGREEKRRSFPGSRAGSVVGGILSGRASPLASGRPSLTHNSVEAIKGALRAALPNGNSNSRPEASCEMAALQENGLARGGEVCQDFLLMQQNDMVSKVEVLDTTETFQKPPVALETQQMPYDLENPVSGHKNLQSHQEPTNPAPPADVMQTPAMLAESENNHRVIGEALREAVEPLRRELAGLKPATRVPVPKKAAALNLNEARMFAKEEFASALKQEEVIGTGAFSMPPLGKLDDTVQLGRINGT